ncbi:phosphonate C-P lyase system protein PhnH [Roseovarius sp.]|uniref:phosphonate C-P lyase system protein PhnH n=1 Tax=Roseovarius sp. TaxID=1486281 RepID=UPI0025F59835|nr:phosphonate C-P lyase system protein PhnH [Roseovarius sp.]
MHSGALSGGFGDAPIDAANAFRAVMNALARPGDICEVSGAVPPAPLSVAAGVVVLTLCDPDTPIYLGQHHDRPDLRDWITFHTGAPIVPAARAMFGLGLWADLPLADFAPGTPEYPDRSATLIVDLPVLENSGTLLRGPGIRDYALLSLPETAAFEANGRLFPLGLDFIFTSGARLAGLPRSTRVG